MAVVENLAPFFRAFGVAGTLDGRPVCVIYDAPGSSRDGIAVTEPQAQIATAQVPEANYRKALVIPQGRFTVVEHVPDGTGMSVLVLEKAA